MPSPLQLRRVIYPAGALGRGGPSFVGPLDEYAAGLAGAWSVARRLLASHTGPLIRARRSSDDEEMDFGALADGTLDVTALDAWRGGDDWFLRTVYDQSGNGRNLGQATAASQPQGMVESGLACARNPHADPVVELTISGLSIPVASTSQWAVGAAAQYMFDVLTLRGTYFRRLSNYSNAAQFDSSGFAASGVIHGLPIDRLYTHVGRLSEARCRLDMADTHVASTDVAELEDTITAMSVGNWGDGPSWSPHSRWYAGAAWSTDLSDSDITSLQADAKTLFGAS